jgi:hypothetical protein
MRSSFYLILLNIFLVGFSPLSAQDNEPANKVSVSKSEKENSDYVVKLGLEKEQAIKFQDINKAYEEGVNALKIKSKSKKTTRKLKALEKDRDKALKDLLSEEQFQKYLEMRRQERGRLKTLIRKSNGQ